MQRPFSSREALRYGWTMTMQNLRPLLMIGAAGALLALFDAGLGSTKDGLGGLFHLVAQAAQVALAMIWMRAALKLHDGGRLEGRLFSGQLDGYFGYLLTWVLFCLVVAAGTALLIVPGVIWGLMFGFAGFVVVDHRSDPIEALKESKHLTEGVKGELLRFALLAFGLNLLGVLALGIGLFVTIPTTFLAGASVYRQLPARAARRTPLLDSLELGHA